jgi:hypothetical protein
MGVSKASLRGLRFSARLEKMREAAQQHVKTVQVTPTKDDYRRVLKHPKAGGFPKSGSAAWPLDRFTERRIRDGDIKVEESAPDAKPKHQSRSDTSSAA